MKDRLMHDSLTLGEHLLRLLYKKFRALFTLAAVLHDLYVKTKHFNRKL